MDLTCSNMYMFLQDRVMGSFSAIYPSDISDYIRVKTIQGDSMILDRVEPEMLFRKLNE